uniref:Uncharacterized protein n=1 Tax=Skeletonema marinoi TaxID=267567 RepID=A0A7S2KY11_9STRA
MDDDNPSSSSTKGVAVRKDPPLFTDHPAPDAKRPCLDNAPNDDIDDDDIDDDEWTSCSMSDRSSSTDSELTELIKNGIKENGGDEYVDEVADHHGVIITSARKEHPEASWRLLHQAVLGRGRRLL